MRSLGSPLSGPRFVILYLGFSFILGTNFNPQLPSWGLGVFLSQKKLNHPLIFFSQMASNLGVALTLILDSTLCFILPDVAITI